MFGQAPPCNREPTLLRSVGCSPNLFEISQLNPHRRSLFEMAQYWPPEAESPLLVIGPTLVEVKQQLAHIGPTYVDSRQDLPSWAEHGPNSSQVWPNSDRIWHTLGELGLNSSGGGQMSAGPDWAEFDFDRAGSVSVHKFRPEFADFAPNSLWNAARSVEMG